MGPGVSGWEVRELGGPILKVRRERVHPRFGVRGVPSTGSARPQQALQSAAAPTTAAAAAAETSLGTRLYTHRFSLPETPPCSPPTSGFRGGGDRDVVSVCGEGGTGAGSRWRDAWSIFVGSPEMSACVTGHLTAISVGG